MHNDADGKATAEPRNTRMASTEYLVRAIYPENGCELTYLTERRCRIQNIAVPDNRVHKLIQASQCSPNHVQASSSIPGLEVPGKRDKNEDEPQESEYGKERVCGV